MLTLYVNKYYGLSRKLWFVKCVFYASTIINCNYLICVSNGNCDPISNCEKNTTEHVKLLGNGELIPKKIVIGHQLGKSSKRAIISYSRYSPVNVTTEYVISHGDNSTSANIFRTVDSTNIASLTYDSVHTIGEINEIRWDYSGHYPNRIYFVVGMKFYLMDVLHANGKPSLVHDFSREFPGAAKIMNDVEGDSSNDSRYWAFEVMAAYNGSTYQTLAIIVFDKQANEIIGKLEPRDLGYKDYLPRPNMVEISPLGTKVLTHYGRCWGNTVEIPGPWTNEGNGIWSAAYKKYTQGNNAFNWVSVDNSKLTKVISIASFGQWANDSKSGKLFVRLPSNGNPAKFLVRVNYGKRPEDKGKFTDGPHAWDLNFTKPVKISVDETHSGWAFDADGREWFVSQNNRTDWIEARDILTGKAINILYHGDLGWGNGFHFGKFYDRSQRGWFLVSTCSKTNSGWAENQIMVAELKSSAQKPIVWRISSTYNNFTGKYRDEAPAALGYDGKTVWWTANGGNADGHGDIYQVRLPDDWYEQIAGPLHPSKTSHKK